MGIFIPWFGASLDIENIICTLWLQKSTGNCDMSKNITLYLNCFSKCTKKKKVPYPCFLRLCMKFKTLKINKHICPWLKKIKKTPLVESQQTIFGCFGCHHHHFLFFFLKSNQKRDEALFVIYLWRMVTVTLRLVSITLSFSISLAGHLLIGCEYVIKPCHIPY